MKIAKYNECKDLVRTIKNNSPIIAAIILRGARAYMGPFNALGE